jgi:sulfite exporter TauE/SafE
MMTNLFPAFLLGLISASHCLGMCGGLMVAAGLNSNKPLLALGYNLGRLVTYVALGTFFGLFTFALPLSFFPYLKLISALLLLLTALYLVGANQLIQKIEYLGKPFWRIAQRYAKKVLPAKTFGSALALGFFWGFIPCGLVYTAVVFSLSQTSLTLTSLSMLAFGLGTLPAMVGVSLFASQLRPLLAKTRSKQVMAIMMLIFSAAMAWQAFQ